MQTEDLGTYYVRTQQEVETIKRQLTKLKPNSKRQSEQHNQLQEYLHDLESNVQVQNRKYYESIINNFDTTVQRLPTLEKSQVVRNPIKELPAPIDQITNIKSIPFINTIPLGRMAMRPKGVYQIKSATQLKKLPLQKSPTLDASSKNVQQGLINLVNVGKLERQEVGSLLNLHNTVMKTSMLNLVSQSEYKRPIQLDNAAPQLLYKIDQKFEQESITKSLKSSVQEITSEKELVEKIQPIIQQPVKSQNQQYRQDNQKEMTYLLQLKNGEFVRDQYFSDFHRDNMKLWPKIEQVLRSLEKIMVESTVQYATVVSRSITKLANDAGTVLRLQDLVQAFENWEELALKLQIPSLIYRTKNGKSKAAIKIQSLWKMYKYRKNYLRLKIAQEKVRVIQDYVRVYLFKQATKQKIKENNSQILADFKVRQKIFKEQWEMISLNTRYEVHVNSLSYEEMKRLSMDHVQQRQQIQLTRVFGVRDRNVNIIYVSGYDLSSEIVDYVYKILGLGDVSDGRNRLHFVSVDCDILNHMTVTRQLIYSSKTIKRIRQLIGNTTAYIVPGLVSNDDILLSHYLQIPLMSGLPQLHQLYSTKSGSKVLLEELQFPTPISMRSIYDEKELINSLSVLICRNPTVDTWLLKIDDETSGRGIASLSVRKLIRGLTLSLTSVAQVLTQQLKQKLHILYPTLFKSYSEYLLAFTQRGGIIEEGFTTHSASPSVNIFIAPSGRLQIISTHQKININLYQPVACISPQTSLKINLEYLCTQLADKLYLKGLFGYFTVDCISLDNGSFQIVGLDCYLNNYSSCHMYFDFLMKGTLDQSTGSYAVESEGNRFFTYCPMQVFDNNRIINEGLEVLQYRTFFQLCRLESISFNLEKKIGSTFILIDSLQSGVLSLLTVGANQLQVIKYMIEAIAFLAKNVGRGHEKIDLDQRYFILFTRCDKINMMAIQQKFKSLLKKIEQKMPNQIQIYL